MTEIAFNGLDGLAKGIETTIGGRSFEITVLTVEESRTAWVKLQPWLVGIMTSEDLAKEGFNVGGVAMAGVTGGLSEETLKYFVDLFAARTSFTTTGENGAVSKRWLKEKGVIDNVFAGAFDEMLEWIDICILMNFGKQIAKQGAALEARAEKLRGTAAKAEPKDPS